MSLPYLQFETTKQSENLYRHADKVLDTNQAAAGGVPPLTVKNPCEAHPESEIVFLNKTLKRGSC